MAADAVERIQAFRLPRQPAWIVQSVGSSRIASRPRARRELSKRWEGAELRGQLLLAEREERHVEFGVGVLELACQLEQHREPAFHVARAEPVHGAVRDRPGMFACAGTVS